MADTSGFITGDDFISFDLGEPGDSPGPSKSPSPGPILHDSYRPSNNKGKGKARAEDSASEPVSGTSKSSKKKRKGDPAGSAEKRVKTKKSPQPRPADEPGPRNLKEERRARERGAPWAHDVDWDRCRDPAEMLNREIHAFYKLMTPTEAEYEVRKTMIDYISTTIQRRWPDATVFAFGSWQTQLYLPTGDIDLVVTNPNFNENNKKRMLNELAGIVRSAGITHTVAVIAKARVPIIKFVTIDGNINVDISVNQTNGIMASKIIPRYLDALPGSRELILVVKAFLAQRSMNEVFTGGLGSYSVICLVISFLQIHPRLRNSEMDARSNLGTLLLEFFELYGRSFNYDAVGISLRRGGCYFLKRNRNWLNMQQSWLLAIEDPQDPDNDISKSSFGIRQVRMTLGGAYDLLQNALYDRAAQILLRDGRPSPDRKVQLPTCPEEWSVLASIMGLTKETFKFRDNMTRLYETGHVKKRLQVQLDLFSTRQNPPKLQSPPPRPVHDGYVHGGSRPAGARRPGSPPPQHAADIEPGELPPPPSGRGYDPMSAITVDDDSAPEDVPSSASSASSSSSIGDDDSSDVEPTSRARDPRSVSEDSSLWSGSPPPSPVEEAEEDTRYAIGKGKKTRTKKKKAKTDAATKAAASTPAPPTISDDKRLLLRAKRERRKAVKREKALQAKQEGAKRAQVNANAEKGEQGISIKGKAKAPSRESSVKPKQRPASAGPSRATTPAVIPSAAASAPGSPRGERGEKVKSSDRAAFWAAKGGKGVIPEEDSEEDL